MDLLTAALLLPLGISIDLNSNGLPGSGQLKEIVGASMAFGLVLAVLALIILATCGRWAPTRPTRTCPVGAARRTRGPRCRHRRRDRSWVSATYR